METTREDKAPNANPAAAGENGKPSPTPSEIGDRAYEIFLERGSVHGHDLDDWLQAEHELKVVENPTHGAE